MTGSQRHKEEELMARTGDGLPQIESLRPTTPEDEAKAKEEVMRRREFAQEIGPQLFECRQEIAEIKALPEEEKKLSPTRMARLEYLENWERTLLNDKIREDGLRESTEFSTFIEEIRHAKEPEAMLQRAITANRARVTDRTTGSNLVFWGQLGYEPVPNEAGQVSKASVLMTDELRKLTYRAKDARRQAYKTNVAILKSKATGPICLEPKPGTPYCFVPSRPINTADGPRRTSEGHFLVLFDGRAFRPGEAICGRGNKELWDALAAGKIYVTLGELRRGRVDWLRNPNEKEREITRLKERYLDILLKALASAPKPAAPPAPPAPPTAPAETPPAETSPLTPGVDGETPGVDAPPAEPAAEKPAPKPKKGANLAKKAKAKGTKVEVPA